MDLREQVSSSIGMFTYCWGWNFFIETSLGNFHWKDPDYNGDNTITLFKGTFKDFLRHLQIPHGRHKGEHVVEDYCGKNFTLVMK